MNFDPNNLKRNVPVIKWATYIPDRVPKFKIHKQLGHAKNASQYRDNYILYELVDDTWIERYRREHDSHPRYCQWCASDTLRSPSTGYLFGLYYSGKHVWPKTGELVQHWVCYDCSHKHFRGEKPPMELFDNLDGSATVIEASR